MTLRGPHTYQLPIDIKFPTFSSSHMTEPWTGLQEEAGGAEAAGSGSGPLPALLWKPCSSSFPTSVILSCKS